MQGGANVRALSSTRQPPPPIISSDLPPTSKEELARVRQIEKNHECMLARGVALSSSLDEEPTTDGSGWKDDDATMKVYPFYPK